MNPHYREVASRARHRCDYCRAPEAVFNFPFEVEHVTPLVLGGSDEVHNLALACRGCNVRKWAYIEEVDPVTRAVVGLYNPRRDRWREHFGVEQEAGVIEGRTAIGRATVARLGMNNAEQRAARQLWIRLGLFP